MGREPPNFYSEAVRKIVQKKLRAPTYPRRATHFSNLLHHVARASLSSSLCSLSFLFLLLFIRLLLSCVFSCTCVLSGCCCQRAERELVSSRLCLHKFEDKMRDSSKSKIIKCIVRFVIMRQKSEIHWNINSHTRRRGRSFHSYIRLEFEVLYCCSIYIHVVSRRMCSFSTEFVCLLHTQVRRIIPTHHSPLLILHFPLRILEAAAACSSACCSPIVRVMLIHGAGW